MEFKILPTDIVLCAIAKNENDYIEEWVEWYFNLGFDKIFVFDDNKDARALPSLPVIAKYVEDGKIGIEHCGNETIDYKQMVKYKKFYSHNKFAWCAFFDIDEFLVLKQHKTIREYLNSKRFSQFHAISICWEFYGDNGHIYKEDGGVVKRFPKPFTGNANNVSDVSQDNKILVKKIIRGGIKNLNFPNPHAVKTNGVIRCCDEKGKSTNASNFKEEKSYELAKINHYFTKSAEEFAEKVKRGRAAQKTATLRKMNEYFSINPKTPDRVEALNKFFGVAKKKGKETKVANQTVRSDKKVLFLVMSCNKPDFLKEEDVVRKTWAKEIVNGEIENVKLFFYRATAKPDAYVEKDVIFVPAKDDWKGTYNKTLRCFKHVIKNMDFDYVVRTNTSNYINVKCLLDMINNIADDDECLYGTRLIINGTSNGIAYFRGNCLVLKKSIVSDIISAEIPNTREVDDGTMAYSLVRKYTKENIDYLSRLRQFPTRYIYGNINDVSYTFDDIKNVVCYRLKNSRQANRSSVDIMNKMYKMDERIRSEENEFSAPLKFNTDIVETINGNISYDSAIKQSAARIKVLMPKLLAKNPTRKVSISPVKIHKNDVITKMHFNRLFA